MVEESNGSEMCILSEFFKVSVFLNFWIEFCDIENIIGVKLWFLWLKIQYKWIEIRVFWCDEIEFSWERSNKIKM